MAAALIAVGVGGAGYFLGPDRTAGGSEDVKIADSVFVSEANMGGDGSIQRFRDVAVDGETIVAVGVEHGANFSRPLFVVSTDAGESWRLARITAADGGDVPLDEYPAHIVVTGDGWVAVAGDGSRAAVWTSEDGTSWIRQANASAQAFGEHDVVDGLAVTSGGLLAIGAEYPGGGSSGWPSNAVLWKSADGTTWQRIVPDLPAEGPPRRIDGVAARNGTLLLTGWADEDGFPVPVLWRSADGGKTWERTNPPGGPGTLDAITASQDAFVLAHRAPADSGDRIAFHASADGRHWEELGATTVPKSSPSGDVLLTASSSGLAAVAGLVEKSVLFTSADGRSWQQEAILDASPAFGLMGLTMVGDTTVVASGRGAAVSDPLITLAPRGGVASTVNLGEVPGLIHPDRLLADVTTGGGRSVAVGAENGEPTVWTSGDGQTWRHAELSVSALASTDRLRLREVAKAESGWVAVGGPSVGPSVSVPPLVVVSDDGRTWQRVEASAFELGDSRRLRPLAVAAGPRGTVIVGTSVSRDFIESAAIWHAETEVRTWQRVEDDSLAGAREGSRRIHDVTAGEFGFVAAGLAGDSQAPPLQRARPAVWTSGDGAEWSLQTVPMPDGAVSARLDLVASNGDTIVALGAAAREGSPLGDPDSASGFAFGYRSTDGGRTWSPMDFPIAEDRHAAEPIVVTDVSTTPNGFTTVGTVGHSGARDVVVWSSTDGRSWHMERPRGRGLSGPGVQSIKAVTVVRDDLVGLGYTANYREEHMTLWRRPLD